MDTFIRPYVLKENASLQVLTGKGSPWLGESLLTIPGLYNRINGNQYSVKQSLSFSGGNLLVNGVDMGAAAPFEAAEATIWPINNVITRISRSAWDFLKDDGRFSLFTGILQYNDSVYNDLFYKANGYAAQTGGYRAQWYYRDSPMQLGMTIFEENGQNYTYPLNTWFVPTDEAFRKAGFQTLDDLIAYNERRGMPDTIFSPADNQG